MGMTILISSRGRKPRFSELAVEKIEVNNSSRGMIWMPEGKKSARGCKEMPKGWYELRREKNSTEAKPRAFLYNQVLIFFPRAFISFQVMNYSTRFFPQQGLRKTRFRSRDGYCFSSQAARKQVSVKLGEQFKTNPNNLRQQFLRHVESKSNF